MGDERDEDVQLVERSDLVDVEVSEFVVESLPRIKVRFGENTASPALRGAVFEAVALGDTYFLSAGQMPALPSNADVISIVDPPEVARVVYFQHEPHGTTINFGAAYDDMLRQVQAQQRKEEDAQEEAAFQEKLRRQQEFIRQRRRT
jgi:hypothetical protein